MSELILNNDSKKIGKIYSYNNLTPNSGKMYIEAFDGINIILRGNNITTNQDIEIIGNVYSPNEVVQTRFVKSQRGIAFSSNNFGINIKQLEMTIEPIFENSLIKCEWYIFGETNSHDSGFTVSLDGSIPTDGYNTAINKQLTGHLVQAGMYENNYSSTPEIVPLHYAFIAKSKHHTIAPVFKSSSIITRTYYLNRTVNSTGSASYETGISWGIIKEVAQ